MSAYYVRFRFNAFRRFENGVRTEIEWNGGLNVLPLEDATAVEEFMAEFQRALVQSWPMDTGAKHVLASEIAPLVFFNLPEGKQAAESLLYFLLNRWARMLSLPLVMGYGCSGLRDYDWKVAVLLAASRKGQSILVVDKANLGETEVILREVSASYTVPGQEEKPFQ